MKQSRQNKVIELIERYDIETQEELADYLKEAGFHVTQATVSRDIRELQLSKVSTEDKRQKYAVHRPHENSLGDRFTRVLKDGLISVENAQNMLVAKTVSGMAMAVAAAIDAMELEEIVGTIAGDDTIMMAVRTAEEAVEVKHKMQKMLDK